MTDEKTIEKLELNKILAEAASFAVLEESKRMLAETRPTAELAEAERMLSLTAEADAALFLHGAGRVEAFPPLADEPERAQKGAALSCGELLAVCGLLRSARVAYRSVFSKLYSASSGSTVIPAGWPSRLRETAAATLSMSMYWLNATSIRSA